MAASAVRLPLIIPPHPQTSIAAHAKRAVSVLLMCSLVLFAERSQSAARDQGIIHVA